MRFKKREFRIIEKNETSCTCMTTYSAHCLQWYPHERLVFLVKIAPNVPFPYLCYTPTGFERIEQAHDKGWCLDHLMPHIKNSISHPKHDVE